MQRIVITGVLGDLGRRVTRLLGDDAFVVGIDDAPGEAPPGCDDLVRDGLVDVDLLRTLTDADTVVHLAFRSETDPEAGSGDDNLAASRRLFEAAAKAGVGHLVVMSSAVVYGARPDNPVPLTEDAPLRPNSGLRHAVERAEVERLLVDFEDLAPGAKVTVLRAAVTVSDDDVSWLASALHQAARIRKRDEAAPSQFLHLDDLAAAVALVVGERAGGVFNVAPDGWLAAADVAALTGARPRLPLDAPGASRLTRWLHRVGVEGPPEGLEPYVSNPWVVANDRLRSLGWRPTHTNEQAFVVSHRASRWTEMSPQRRQELALTVSGVALVGAAAGVVLGVRRRSR